MVPASSRSPKETLPTMYDLPSEDPEEPGLPDEFHDLQPQLLSRTLRLTRYSRDNYFTASDLNLYYDVHHPRWYKRPDWFLAVNVPRLYEQKELRRSYVTWQEGKSPYVAIEFLSPGTEAEDLGRFYDEANLLSDRESTAKEKPPGKFEVYEEYLRIPHYIVYDRHNQQLRYFKLDGGQYQAQALNPQHPVIWLADLEIGLGIWQGEFEGATAAWLRWCDHEGNWLLTDTERSHQQTAQAELQLLQAARNLLVTGMEQQQVIQLLGLSEAQVEVL